MASLRGLATEFGLTVPQGIGRISDLMVLIETEADLPKDAQQAFKALFDQFTALGNEVENIEARIVAHARSNAVERRLATIPGIGPITGSLLAATVADISVFASARHFAAWLCLVPRQSSTGGKTRLGRITNAGNSEIRRMLVLGATSMVYRAERWNTVVGSWVRAALTRRPTRLVTVALANKMARVAWALMTRQEDYCP